MNIQPIVEGFGEVRAVPVLLRRLRDLAGAFAVDVGRPIRKNRHELVTEGPLREAVRLALQQPECRALLVIFDSDDDCPRELAPRLLQWAKKEAQTVPCAIVMATREYEAWFLASVESLRGKRGIPNEAASHPDPEAPRGAKERLEHLMQHGRKYVETGDQAAMSAAFDMQAAYRRCRSFRHLINAFGQLAQALGCLEADWPPPEWQEKDEV